MELVSVIHSYSVRGVKRSKKKLKAVASCLPHTGARCILW